MVACLPVAREVWGSNPRCGQVSVLSRKLLQYAALSVYLLCSPRRMFLLLQYIFLHQTKDLWSQNSVLHVVVQQVLLNSWNHNHHIRQMRPSQNDSAMYGKVCVIHSESFWSMGFVVARDRILGYSVDLRCRHCNTTHYH